MNKIIVYTAITNGYDRLHPVPEAWRDSAHFVAFLDQPQPARGWEIRPICRRFGDPCRNAKIHKILAHRYFPHAEYSLWVDGSVVIKSTLPLPHWVETYLSQSDLAVFKHRLRNCLYQEGAVCLALGYDSRKLINRQMQKYFALGYPPNNGLAECTVLFRRHTVEVKQLNEEWYQEIRAHSRRDQLSFNYVAHKLNFKYSHLPGNISSNAHFEWRPHLLARRPKVGLNRDSALDPTQVKQFRKNWAKTAASGVSMVYLYYDNPHMLVRQIECWNAYPQVFKESPEVLLIDDGSPKTFAADIVRKVGCRIPLKVYRIWEDIPWNFSGARNLGCAQANDWIYVSDIDTLLLAEDAQKFFAKRALDPTAFYMPRRVWLPDLMAATPGIVNLLFHKEKFREIGGYDEDYAGFYGREETDFHHRLKQVAGKIYRKDVLIRVMPHKIIRDARTITKWPRDKTRNSEIYARKEARGFANPVSPLRFSWDRVF